MINATEKIHLAIAKFHDKGWLVDETDTKRAPALKEMKKMEHFHTDGRYWWLDYQNSAYGILRALIEAEIGIERDGNFYVITGPQVSSSKSWQTKVVVPYRELRGGLIRCLYEMIPATIEEEENDDG